ncbi:guanine nucleotide exchange factor [Podospora fimiseda]|uniref:Guanine nucleotide exchange factor n=1 Tax=Podospora fimiseda TaxID=252190 RepID=A0AAN7GUF8_9PEZI|nr:guanine nucleotide exchange factor [Podospora fimiseda]
MSPAKLEAVTSIVSRLSDDLQYGTLQPEKRDTLLEELKIYGRDPSFADPIFTKDGIKTLSRHAFDSSSDTTAQNALRVLCNALLLKPETRQSFVSTGYALKACRRLQNNNPDDEFLVSRLLLLSTYGTNIDMPKLVEAEQLANTLANNLARHAERLSSESTSKANANPMLDMALVETLKLFFNATQYAPDNISSFEPAIPHITTILCSLSLPSQQTKTPLDPPFGLLINALMNLKFSSSTAKDAVYPPSSPFSVADRLIQLLVLSMKAYSSADLEQIVSPLVCVLSAVHEDAPAPVRKSIRDALLPTESDREDVLGKTDTLPSRLLRNWTNPEAPELGKAISHLYFDMSDKDPSTFVKNVGYGYASGFLFQKGINIDPHTIKNSEEAEGSDGVREIRRPVNPITGQFLDTEKPVEMPEMTDEEKEREAERLFVLFERLKKTGIIDVQNPVEQAMREGQFEELSDDE